MSKTTEGEREHNRCQVTFQSSTMVLYIWHWGPNTSPDTLTPCLWCYGTNGQGQESDSWSVSQYRKCELGARTGNHFSKYSVLVLLEKQVFIYITIMYCTLLSDKHCHICYFIYSSQVIHPLMDIRLERFNNKSRINFSDKWKHFRIFHISVRFMALIRLWRRKSLNT